MAQAAFLSLFLFITAICAATDLKPWFGNEYETEIRATVLYQNYHSISAPHHHAHKRNENDRFTTFSAAYPFRRYCGEFEVTSANTRHQKYRWDNFRVTGRHQWASEIDGDPLSMVAGLTLTEPLSRALHDISSFHHGHLEGEIHFSLGKKYGYPQCCKDYLYRWWNVIGFGIADVGSPWVRGDAAFEYNYDGINQFRGFINTLWGLGRNNLRIHRFKGYGSIEHKSVDLGIRYGYTLGCFGTLSLQYAHRVYAYNFPKNANLVLLEYYFPFGTQNPSTY